MTTSIPAVFYNSCANTNNKNSGVQTCSKQKQQCIINGPQLPYQQDQTVGAYLLQSLHKHSNKIAQVDPITGDYTTFNDIKLLSLKLAQALRQNGIGRGDVVSICSTNNLDVCLPMLGALYVGATVAPLHPSLCRPDLKHLLSITQPKIIFCDYTSIEIIRKSLAELKFTIDLIIFGDTKVHKSLDRFLNDVNSTDEQFTDEHVFNCFDPWNETAFIVPTNGTRDLPRGVCISHATVLQHLQSYWNNMEWSNCAILTIGTLYSIDAIKSMLVCFDQGNITIVSPEFNSTTIAKIINDWKGDLILILSTVHLIKLLNASDINKYNLNGCKLILTYGNRLTDLHYKLANSIFTNAQLYLSYGSVETFGMITTSVDNKFCCGQIDPDCQIKIIDPESGKILGPNQSGELQIKGKRIMSGYYEDELATSVVLDKDGWYKTGDLAYYDTNQHIYIEGAITDKFTYKNCEVMPFEIEKVLLNHSEIQEVCIVGVRNRLDGYRARAFIVRSNESNISEARIKKYLESQLSPYKQITGGITFMEKLPMTPSGKINRRTLIKLP